MIGAMGELILLRHGATEWSAAGRHTGRTDVPLTPKGVAQAAALAPMLTRRAAEGHLVAVFTSPAQRAVRTAELAGLDGPGRDPDRTNGPATDDAGSHDAGSHDTGSHDTGTSGTGTSGTGTRNSGSSETVGTTRGPLVKQDPDLWEWDYGGYEGGTTADIQRERPGWYLWRDGVIPGDAEHPGETVESVGERTDRVLKRAAPLLADGDVALVAHGHVLRVLTARWLGLPPSDGRLFRLDTGTVSTLGTEHDEPVIVTWNVPPDA
jgi:broad specificity phosphatase PhoE